MKQYTSLLGLAVILCVMVGYGVMSAQTNPTGAPPSGNVPAPINVGTSTQIKEGNIGANIVAATTEMRSDRYCDAIGSNCRSATSTTAAAGGGDEIVMLSAPRMLFTSADLRHTGSLNKAYDLVANGFPANTKSLYFVVSGQIDDADETCTGGGGDRSCSTDPARVPFVGYRGLFATNALPIANPTSATFATSTQWVPISDTLITLATVCGADCGNANYTGFRVGSSDSPHLNIAIGGYECMGSCGAGNTQVRLCDVQFNSSINGKNTSLTRAIPGSGNMGIGMYYHKDNWDNPTIPFSLEIDRHSWGSSFWDSGEKGRTGFVTPADYNANLGLFNSWNSSSYSVITPLSLTTGSTVTITNEGVNDVPAGRVTLTATVGACTQ